MKRVLYMLGALLVLSPLVFVPTPEAQGQSLGSGNATLSWFPPTSRIDGSPLVVADHRIWRDANGEQVWGLVATVSGGIATYVDDNLFNGTYCYRVTARDSFGLESDPSNTACKTVTIGGNNPRPLAPTGLVVQ
jgi:hypothetical protein